MILKTHEEVQKELEKIGKTVEDLQSQQNNLQRDIKRRHNYLAMCDDKLKEMIKQLNLIETAIEYQMNLAIGLESNESIEFFKKMGEENGKK